MPGLVTLLGPSHRCDLLFDVTFTYCDKHPAVNAARGRTESVVGGGGGGKVRGHCLR